MFALENNVLDVEKYLSFGGKYPRCGEKPTDWRRGPLKAALNCSCSCFRSFKIDGFGAFEEVMTPYQEEVPNFFQNIHAEHRWGFFQ